MTFILVTDDFTLRILSSFMKMMELVNYGITAI
jgi:syntaxin-binding protein 1